MNTDAADSRSLLAGDLSGWKMAGSGRFDRVADGTVESRGGSGLLWYADETFEDFALRVEWRVTHRDDNSGVFIRCPPLRDDPGPAIERGYEIQIDDRGYDPERCVEGSPLHLTGAIYTLAPAGEQAFRPVGEWNAFEIVARGATIEVRLNGRDVSCLTDASREPRGHIALQAHHEGSRVQFRELRVGRLG